MFRVHCMRGCALLTLGRFHEAAFILREAQLLAQRAAAVTTPAVSFPDSTAFPLKAPDRALAEVTTFLADALTFTGRADEALDLLNASAIFDTTPQTYTRLARLHERRGDYLKAAEHWRAAGEEYAPLADPAARAGLVGPDLGLSYDLREQDLDGSNFDPSSLLNTVHKRVTCSHLLCATQYTI